MCPAKDVDTWRAGRELAVAETQTEPETKKRRFFYGWWLLGAGTMGMTLHGGMFSYGFASFFLPLASALGVSRGVLSIAFSFTRLESSLLGPIEGFLIDRLGPRRIMFGGYFLFGLSYILFSFVDSLLEFYLIFPLMALGASMAGFLPVVTAITNWFSRRRGFAIGISSAGVNFGGILVAVVALAITMLGWRSAALVLGLIIWAVGFPVASMMRHRPQQYGYLPDGDQPEESQLTPGDGVPSQVSDNDGAVDLSTDDGVDFTPMQALRTSAFWILAASHGISLIVVASIALHEIPLLVDAGVSYNTAASVLAFMTFVAMVGRVIGGYIGDKFGRKPILVVCFLLMSAGILVLATAQNVPQALVFAVLYGLGYGARAPLFTALRGDFFGPKNFATIMGLGQPVMMIGSFSGPVVAGLAYDVQGSYRMVFTIYAIFILVGAVLVFFIKKPTHPQHIEAAPVVEADSPDRL
jgi:MFS family permease